MAHDLEEADDERGIRFLDLSFDEALEAAARQNKLIFLDAFTIWCGPCKIMDAEVFSREDVGHFFNPNFINLKIDMEKGEGPELMKRFGIRAFPTFLLINHEGELVHRLVGMQEAQPSMASIRRAMQNENSLQYLTSKYAAGDRSSALVRNYVTALSEGSESRRINQVLADYFTALTVEERFKQEHSFVYQYSPALDEERFKFFLGHADELRTALGISRFEAIMDQVCVPMLVSHQAEWKNPQLLSSRFSALLPLDLSHESETGALVGLIKLAGEGDLTQVLHFLEQNVDRFSDLNQLFALYQLLSVPVSGTPDQKVRLQQLLKQVILKNRTESVRSSLVNFLERVEKSMVGSEEDSGV